ncbi:hypothetical protein [Ornithinibacter aureus]|nr:hypothetical protein [Ornithinibacter aureus]
MSDEDVDEIHSTFTSGDAAPGTRLTVRRVDVSEIEANNFNLSINLYLASASEEAGTLDEAIGDYTVARAARVELEKSVNESLDALGLAGVFGE